MRNRLHHPANGVVIDPLDDLVQARKAQPLDDQLMLHRGVVLRAIVLNADLPGFGHDQSSSTCLPRIEATSLLSRNCTRASNVALITLCGLAVPRLLVSTFCTPAEVITARTAPPAITPVPSGAGFSSTWPEPYRPSTWWGMVVLVRFTLNRFFLADSIPLRIACGTSFALPEPYPTTPEPASPTTTSAANDMFLPPFTTLVTRLMATTWSFRLYWLASSFFFNIVIALSQFTLLSSQFSAIVRTRHEPTDP